MSDASLFAETKYQEAQFNDVKDVAASLNSSLTTGLTAAEAKKRLDHFGRNELTQEPPTPLWKLVLEQFDDLLVKILLGAAVISFVLAMQEDDHGKISPFVEPCVILLILVLNAIVGVWQEHNAENALDALKAMQPKLTTVIREGKTLHEFPVEDLVPGDLVDINIGDRVPADMRIVKHLTTTLRIDQSAMTGESVTVLKQVHTHDRDDVDLNASVLKAKNMVFSSTVVTGGRARCMVCTTGMGTRIGGIAQDVATEDDEKTPLKEKLDQFGEQLANVIGVICLAVWAMNYNQFFDPVHGTIIKGCIYYFKIAVALGVAAIPEGLPAVITLCLALGTRKMVQKNAIVRKLPSVETLGCCTVICSDKTGTLTLNEMTVTCMVHAGSSPQDLVRHEVSSTANAEGKLVGGYDPTGEVKTLGAIQPGDRNFMQICALCNDAFIKYENETKKYVRAGEPTEAALRVLVEKMTPHEVNKTDPFGMNALITAEHKKTAVLEFSRGRKSMSVLFSAATGAVQNVLYCKGAPESVLARCNRIRMRDGSTQPLSNADRAAIMIHVNTLASTPLRTLALAIREDLPENLKTYDGSEEHPGYQAMCVEPDAFAATIEKDMVFVGLVGIKDPPREEVKASIALCRQAGIRVIMITGDKKETAEAIAREIGIFQKDEDISTKSFTGAEFFALSEEKQLQYLMQDRGGRAFSRTDPADKKKLVQLLKDQGEVAAMTGDGVNDAPALKAASIGIAMGSGTEVAKEASDMVLADDNFSTIVAAVEEGRSIYSNMKAFIRYLISSNIGEVASIFFTAALGIPEGLIPVQLLWVNLVTDGPPATALGFNPADPDVMRKPPRSSDDTLISPWVFFRYFLVGTYVGFATVGIFVYWYLYYDWAGDNHTLVTFDQLSHWGKCSTWDNFQANDIDGYSFQSNPCSYFTAGKAHASTLSLTVLVLIEMLNALNALSEDSSLLTMPPWCNPYVCLAIVASLSIHCVILYIPWLADVFSIVPLTYHDWLLCWIFSIPVIFIDEILKFVGRILLERELAIRLAAKKND